MSEVLDAWGPSPENSQIKCGTGKTAPELFQRLSAQQKTEVILSGASAFSTAITGQVRQVANGICDGTQNVAVGFVEMGKQAVDLVVHPTKMTAEREHLAHSADRVCNRAAEYLTDASRGNVQPLSDAAGVARSLMRSYERLSTYEKSVAGTEVLLSFVPFERMAEVSAVGARGVSNLADLDAKYGRLLEKMDATTAKYQGMAGAGRGWEIMNERTSADVVKQIRADSCVAAVGEMLTKGRIDQPSLINILGSPADPMDLATSLGPAWVGKALNPDNPKNLEVLLKRGSWAAELRSPKGPSQRCELGHMVVVDGVNEEGHIMIRDPMQGTRYEMNLDDFSEAWTGRVAFRK